MTTAQTFTVTEHDEQLCGDNEISPLEPVQCGLHCNHVRGALKSDCVAPTQQLRKIVQRETERTEVERKKRGKQERRK